MIEFQVRAENIPKIFEEFSDVIGETSWTNPVQQKILHSQQNKFLCEHYAHESVIAFELATCTELVARHGQLLPSELSRLKLHQASTFAVQTLSILNGLPPKHHERFVARIRNALKNPDAMRGLLLELAVATHFARRGNKVLWPEFELHHPALAGSTFDLFIEDIGPNGLEVECKSVSHDRGRKFHTVEALNFQDRVKHKLEPFSKTIQTGIAVILTVPDRLPTAHADLDALAMRVREQVLANESKTFDDGASVRVVEFDIALLRDVDLIPDSPGIRAVVEKVTGTRNRDAMIIGRRNVGAIVFVAQSAGDDSLLDAVFKTASEAAKQQLTKTRPGILVLGFDGIEADELRSIAQQDHTKPGGPTALRKEVSKFLAGEARDHVVGVGFFSRAALIPQRDGSIDTVGAAYWFAKEESSFWHADFANIFSTRA